MQGDVATEIMRRALSALIHQARHVWGAARMHGQPHEKAISEPQGQGQRQQSRYSGLLAERQLWNAGSIPNCAAPCEEMANSHKTSPSHKCAGAANATVLVVNITAHAATRTLLVVCRRRASSLAGV
jgi:hypothetical protein